MEGAAVAQRLQGPVEGQLFGGKGLLKRGQEQSAEETCEHAHRQKEVRPAGGPAAAVPRKTAAGNDAVQVWMMEQGLAPRMKNGEEAKLRTEVFGIGGDYA